MEGFVEFTTPDYQFGWFNRDVFRRLDAFLAAVIRRQSPRLMLMAPPRHGKSEAVSRKFPAYIFGRYPDLSIIATSYGADLSSTVNREVQRLIDEPRFAKLFPETALSGSAIGMHDEAVGTWARNNDIFEIVGHKGSYRSAGVGGGITGRGGDVLIVDDPVKDALQANSEVHRQGVWDWYRSTLYTRREPGAGILLVMTRWHIGDLAGRLLEAMANGGEQWEVASYRAIAEEDEASRNAGEALHADRYDLAALTSTKVALGPYNWEALYQQRPIAREGALFKLHWFENKVIDFAPADCTWWRHWDLAASVRNPKATNQAWTAGVKMGFSPSQRRYFIADVKRLQAEGHEVRSTIRAVAELDGHHVKISVPLDPGAGGKFQAQDFIAGLSGFLAFAHKESGDKGTRAEPFAAQCAAGNVYLIRGDWNRPYLEELALFPTGASAKDQVDASSAAFERLSRNASPITFTVPFAASQARNIPG